MLKGWICRFAGPWIRNRQNSDVLTTIKIIVTKDESKRTNDIIRVFIANNIMAYLMDDL